MKPNTKIFLTAVALFILCISGCTRPDRVTDETEYCNTGISVLAIDDSYVNDTIRQRIYNPANGSGIISTTHANYNALGRVIVIPFTFTDLPWNTAVSTSVIDDCYFGLNRGSYNDYFLENSYGQFGLTKVAIAPTPVNVPFALADWRETTTDPSQISTANLLQYICQTANVDWTRADVNGDHNITPNEVQVVVVYAAGVGGICRPNTFAFSSNHGGTYTIDNKFTIIDCKRNDATDRAIHPITDNSTACHELGHAFFGLPDRYGVSGVCATGITGPYDMMSDNCSWKHFTMYDKMKIGWVHPKILDMPENRPDHSRHCYEFPASEGTPAAVILWTHGASGEYFIIENRNKAEASHNFEGGLPESGLAVWWASTSGDDIHLVSFQNWGEISSSYNYDDWSTHTGALFVNRHEYGATVPIVLRNNDNIARFSFRAISPAGAVMHAEL